MKIRDLPHPVTASKADWLPGTTWIGFTPTGQGPGAVAQCQATVQRQFGTGYIIERITQSFGKPNPEFANDPIVKENRERHESLKDRLVAVHRLQSSAIPLISLIGKSEFNRLQDIWAEPNARKRWSVAFPIVETFDIVNHPRAIDVFPPELRSRLYQSQSALLRPFDDEARSAIADLEIKRMDAPNAWVKIDHEIAMAKRSMISQQTQILIDEDLSGFMEGETDERKQNLRLRAAMIADRFVRDRGRSDSLICDKCGFNPKGLTDGAVLPARSCLDVHHISPLSEGKRITTSDDLSLLCPTCHRLVHVRMDLNRRQQKV